MRKLHYLAILLILFCSCSGNRVKKQAEQASLREVIVSQQGFDTIIDNKKVELYTLRNAAGCSAQFTNFGARWVSMEVPDRNGVSTDVVLGFSNLRQYLKAGEPYHGAIVGRICGRINKGVFTLDGKKYKLSNNDLFGSPVKNHLHGGIKGFHRQVWNGIQFRNDKGEEGITFTYLSPDGEEGFPGNLKADITYLLTSNNEVHIEYTATTDKSTLVNLTSHAYFNLNGEGNGNILDHLMKIDADNYVESDKELIPTGEIRNVAGTPLDYREFRPMGYGIEMDHDQIIKGKGYAAAMALNVESGKNKEIAVALSNQSGIKLEIFSDRPSLQIYNAWLFDGKDTGKSGKGYMFSGGFVMEPQGYPDAPNHSNFPSIVLRPGELYHHTDIYRFSTFK